MESYAHIVAVGLADGTYDQKIPEYQITLNVGGASWARSLDGNGELVSFLESSLALRKDIVDAAVRQLHETGHATIPAVEISEVEAPALGLVKTPIDF